MDRRIIAAALAAEATDAELEELRIWRAADPANEWEYRRLARLWAAAGDLGASDRDVPAPSAAEIVGRVTGTSAVGAPAVTDGLRQRTSRTGDSSPSRWRKLAIAVSLVAGVGLGALLSSVGDRNRVTPTVFATGLDQVATVTLADGTVAQLAPESRLEFSPQGATREVNLVGRAYFAVAHNPEKPFRVHLPTGSVEVLGTRFDVQSRDGNIQVAVVEGQVRLDARGGRVMVGARQIARAAEERAPEVEQVEDVYQIVSWLEGFFAFQSTPLPEVATELERRFGVRIEITDDDLLERTITGWFADQTPAQVIAGICRAVNALCTTVDDNVIRMTPGPTLPTPRGESLSVSSAPLRPPG